MIRISVLIILTITSINLFAQEKTMEDTCCYVGKQFLLPISFQVGSNELNKENKLVLEYLAKSTEEQHLRIEIGVHADERLNETYKSTDTRTTCKRAEIIKQYLLFLGVKQRRITAKGYRGRNPYFVNAKTEEEHQINRRIVVTILSKDE